MESVKTNSAFKILRRRIDTIVGLAIDYKFIVKKDGHSTELLDKIRDVWELFTDTPRKANGRSAAGVKNDIARLRLEQETKIKFIVIEIEKLLFQIAMQINRK